MSEESLRHFALTSLLEWCYSVEEGGLKIKKLCKLLREIEAKKA